jgi:hypothetical protein
MLWKTYFWLMILLVVFGQIALVYGEATTVLDVTLLAVTLAQLVGLFGYVFKRPILSAAVWRWLFPIFIVAFLVTVFEGAYRFNLDPDVAMVTNMLTITIFSLLVLFPLLLANYRYAFRSENIWHAPASARP